MNELILDLKADARFYEEMANQAPSYKDKENYKSLSEKAREYAFDLYINFGTKKERCY